MLDSYIPVGIIGSGILEVLGMIIEADKNYVSVIAGLAILLWDDNSIEGLIEEFSEIILREDVRVFIKYEGDIPIGFAQCQLRHDYVEGTETSPVGYLEGIFIKEGFRNKGYARELLDVCERWACIKGCKEFASDCGLDNIISLQFHKAVGFVEANRIICFTKKL